ncbi:MAG: hypothetical protein BGN88_00160 [Clostridiales bacterium 43-6]|nr:MAG: hypothetical protein BGN88_00160 [Clostridiales bacterium 43-6]
MARKKKKVNIVTSVLFLAVVGILSTLTFSPYLELPVDLPSWADLKGTDSTPVIETGDNIHIIDVGQGDAILIKSGDKTALIDTGPGTGTTKLLRYLNQRNIKTIDALILTHPHEDHIGGATAVLTGFDVQTIYMMKSEGSLTPTTKTYTTLLTTIKNQNKKIKAPATGDNVKLGNFTLNFFAPKGKYDNLNNYSIIVKAVHQSTSAIFMGDAETAEETELLKSGFDVAADLLKVGHHGSKTSSSEAFLEAVKPSFGAISLAKDNDYGHPHGITLSKMNKRNITVYRTDQSGNLLFTTDGSKFTVKAEKQ